MIKETKSTKKEHDAIIAEMKTFAIDYKPKVDNRLVGIFWYDAEKNELFGVVTKKVSDLKRNESTINKLHYSYWKSQGYKRTKDLRFKGKYEDTPRGRVIIEPDDSITVFVGKWYEPYKDKLTKLIKKTFKVKDFTYKYDEHLDLGHGPSGEFIRDIH